MLSQNVTTATENTQPQSHFISGFTMSLTRLTLAHLQKIRVPFLLNWPGLLKFSSSSPHFSWSSPHPKFVGSFLHHGTQFLQHPVTQLRGALPGRVHHPDDAVQDGAVFAALQQLRHGAVPKPTAGWPMGDPWWPILLANHWLWLVETHQNFRFCERNMGW